MSHLANNYRPAAFKPDWVDGGLLFLNGVGGYVDAICGYGVTSAGHNHPVIMAALQKQLVTGIVTTSRAMEVPGLTEWADELCTLTGMDMVLPMVTGAEAVETAIKVTRLWGYRTQYIANGEAVIVYADGNFHGRTTTIVGMSSDPHYREGFGVTVTFLAPGIQE